MKTEHKLKKVPFTKVKIEDDFWKGRLKKHQETTLKACINQCEATGRISNFEKAAGLKEGSYEGILFNDSDVYKIIEGIAYSLMNYPNKKLELYTDTIIDKISKAQEKDGYLNTYFTLEKPDEKWTDMSAHETYCTGHLIEAAIAYKRATGKGILLETALKAVDEYFEKFDDDNTNWITGHQEIELALIKLYNEIREEKYAKLSKWFIEKRGKGYEFKSKAWDRESVGGVFYNQDDKPIRELEKITGHAVRAMYYYSAATEIAQIYKDESIFKAIEGLWENTVKKNMYITGGIGSSRQNEGFAGDYKLPNKSAYCETCASVGMLLWNHRMNLVTADSKYADIMELCIYNSILSGVSLDGKKFFYENPLETDGTHHREEWYDVSCCPTQIARFLPSIGDYIYATTDNSIWINLYLSNTCEVMTEQGIIGISQESRYPWEGNVRVRIDKSDTYKYSIYFRYPGWCKSAEVSLNNKPVEYEVEKGYIKIQRKWKVKDIVDIKFEMPVERICSNEKVKDNLGKLALKRGPIVYCFEETDNIEYDKIQLDDEVKFNTMFDKDMLDGIVKIITKQESGKFTAIPYYAWDNREPGRMKVWVTQNQPKEEKLYKYCDS